jgi:hypothetical protein
MKFAVVSLKIAAIMLWVYVVFMPALLTVGPLSSLVHNVAEEVLVVYVVVLFALFQWHDDVRLVVAASVCGVFASLFGVNGQAYWYLSTVNTEVASMLYVPLSTLGVFAGAVSVALLTAYLFKTHHDKGTARTHVNPML